MFQGWDFSYLDGGWQLEGLPWCYKSLVKVQRSPELKLLDLDTGAVVCFVKIIEWEFPGFSVAARLKPLKAIEKKLKKTAFIPVSSIGFC